MNDSTEAISNPTTSHDTFTAISLNSLHSSHLCYDNSHSLSQFNCDGSDDRNNTLRNCQSHHSSPHITVKDNSVVAPSSLQLAEMQSNPHFFVQRFYSSVGGWIFPALFSSCFRPVWKNIFSTRTESSLKSSSSESSESGFDFEIVLEQIDVNFKENYIGGGNQSSVFRGKFNGRFIALKKLNRASEVDILTLTSLDHPNIIKTIGMCTRDIYPIIIMEYCEKGGLFDVLRKVDVTKACFLQWVNEIVDGMKYLHSRKIVHRDLKSPNILVDSGDRLKICDFGSLYAWEKTFMPSVVMSVCGTSQWMSPEMLKNEPCNEKVDVWSFGVVMWELLTQEVPYKSISPMAIMYGVGSGLFVAFIRYLSVIVKYYLSRQLKLHVPKSVPSIVEMILSSCWTKRPHNRPSFVSIGTHLANLRVSVADMNEDVWQIRKNVWRREINEENAKRYVFSGNLKDQEAEELILKRQHELRHLQELRTVYERKTKRAERYTQEVFTFCKEIQRYEAELMQQELELFGKNNIHNRFVTRNKVHQPFFNENLLGEVGDRNEILSDGQNAPQKSTIVGKASEKNQPHKTNTNGTPAYDNGGSFSVVTLTVDDNDKLCTTSHYNREDGEHNVQWNMAKRCFGYSDEHFTDEPLTQSSYSFRDSDEEDLTDSVSYYNNNKETRDKMMFYNDDMSKLHENQSHTFAKSSHLLAENLNMAQLQLSSNNIPTTCPCCQHQFVFDRNSLARASNMSSDSGFCHLDDMTSRSNNSHFGFDFSASNSGDYFSIDRSASDTFERFHPNNTSVKALKATTGFSRNLWARSQLNRSIHSTVGRASIIGDRDSTHQNESHSFDESCCDCSQMNYFCQNMRGRWSGNKKRSLLLQRHPTSRLQRSIGKNTMSENPVANITQHHVLQGTSWSTSQGAKAIDLMVDNGISHDCPIESAFQYSTNKTRRNSSTIKHFANEKDSSAHQQISSKKTRILQYMSKDITNHQETFLLAQKHSKKAMEIKLEDFNHQYCQDNENYAEVLKRRQNWHKSLSRRSKSNTRQPSLSQRNIQVAGSKEVSHGNEVKDVVQAMPCSQNHLKKAHVPNTSTMRRSPLRSMTSNSSAIILPCNDAALSKVGTATSLELERSLEAAAANSDGLSDKERELHAAKSSFKTHHRTANNPCYTPSTSYRAATTTCETSTESDNDPIYC